MLLSNHLPWNHTKYHLYSGMSSTDISSREAGDMNFCDSEDGNKVLMEDDGHVHFLNALGQVACF